MVKSFGSSVDEAEIAQMVERAREFIARQTGTFYNLFNPPSEPDITDFVNNFEGHICICFCAYVLQLEMERLLKAAQSSITVERARELVKTMYALTYTKPAHTSPTKVMLGMDEEQGELYRLVEDWVKRDLGNAWRKQVMYVYLSNSA